MHTFIVIAIAFAIKNANCDIFSSSAHLQSLMFLERHLVGSMYNYLLNMETTLEEIKSYLNEFSETAGRKEFQGSFESQDIIGNPLQAFQLVKRLTINWSRINQRMNDQNWKYIEDLTKVYNVFMPEQEDLHGAALALIRLQDTYNLNMSDLSRGNIFGYQTNIKMTARDCLFIGKHSFNNGYYGQSIEWFEEALIKAHHEGNKTASVEEIMPFYDMAVEIHHDLEINRSDSESIESLPNKLRMFEGDNEDYRRYQALCRGETLRTPEQEKNLKCYVSHKNHPFLLLQPIKVEVFHENPLVLMFHSLMTEYEQSIFRELATPLLTRARVQTDSHDDEVSTVRTSQTAWFSPDNHVVVGNINRRVEAATGLSLNMDKSHCELVQVANYGMGGHYVPHYDYLIVDRPPHERHLAPAKEIYAGDRTATLMFYLSDVIRGGSTVFPRLGVAVSPEKGSAVFWYNLYRNGEGIEDTLHGACPVVMGEKWVANYWIREIGQAFRRKCSLNANE